MDAQEATSRGVRAVVLSIATNAVLALVKCVAGVAGHSYALVADGVESTSDVAGSIVVYAGLRLAARPADANHPYGHGKAEPLATILLGLALLLAAGVIGTQSVREIRTPHEMPAPFTLGVLAVVVLAKATLSRYAASIATTIESTAVAGDAAHHFSDGMFSGLAFVGISIGLWTNRPEADDWAALCAVPLIVVVAIRQLRRPVAELLDTAPPFVEATVRQCASAVPGVAALDKCFVRKMGLSYYVDLHVVVDGALSVREGHAIAHDVQRVIRACNQRVADVLVHIEPSLTQE
jgi:cation diffusion facilitator family transporter